MDSTAWMLQGEQATGECRGTRRKWKSSKGPPVPEARACKFKCKCKCKCKWRWLTRTASSSGRQGRLCGFAGTAAHCPRRQCLYRHRLPLSSPSRFCCWCMCFQNHRLHHQDHTPTATTSLSQRPRSTATIKSLNQQPQSAASINKLNQQPGSIEAPVDNENVASSAVSEDKSEEIRQKDQSLPAGTATIPIYLLYDTESTAVDGTKSPVGDGVQSPAVTGDDESMTTSSSLLPFFLFFGPVACPETKLTGGDGDSTSTASPTIDSSPGIINVDGDSPISAIPADSNVETAVN
ncbi:hypothetical protein QBC35DRAFT_532535 [Podospora australis]|uniref:Uncharacterized protein n=1 Tax=Podospora australis TaxID=1536484 RepID=A0AAN6WSK4_9PEZI|nr:hypothetical protein QBC35DRAFT_532535 [Podospora australis]